MGALDRRVLFAYIAVLVCFIGLGSWQLIRGFEKRAMLDSASVARSFKPLPVEQLVDPTAAAEEYRLVKVAGRYQANQQFLWDNRIYKGRAGFEVIVPIQLENGTMVLVNRGWVPLGVSREQLPNVTIPEQDADTVTAVTGLFSRPSKGFASGPAFNPNEPWPRIMQYFDYQAIEKALSAPLIAGVVQPQLPDQSGASGIYFIQNWKPAEAMGPARHYGYAAQWWTMALVLTLLFYKYGIKSEKP